MLKTAEEFLKQDKLHEAKLRSLFQGACSHHSRKLRKVDCFTFEEFCEFLNSFIGKFKQSEFREFLGKENYSEKVYFKDFIRLMFQLSLYRYGKRNLKMSKSIRFTTKRREVHPFSKFLEFIYHTKTYRSYLSKIPNFLWKKNDQKVEFLVYQNYTCLAKMFCKYGGFDVEVVYNDLFVDSMNKLRFDQVRDFMKDFEVFPMMVSSIDVENLYRSVSNLENDEIVDNDIENFDSNVLNANFGLKGGSISPFMSDLKTKINFNNFLNFLTRAGIFVYSQPSYNIDCPTFYKKIRLFFKHLNQGYKKVFKKTMKEDEIDFESIVAPYIESIDPVEAMCGGHIEFTLRGENFDRRLGGVFVNFDGKHNVEVISISKVQDRCMCLLPSVNELGYIPKLRIHVEKNENEKLCYKIHIEMFVSCDVSCTNDRKKFSNSKKFQFIDRIPPISISAEITENLFKIFKRYCCYHDADNFERMAKKKWDIFMNDVYEQLKQYKFMKRIDLREIFNKYCTREEGQTGKCLKKRIRSHGILGDDMLTPEEIDTDGYGGLAPPKKMTLFVTLFLDRKQFLTGLVHVCLFDLENIHPLDFLIHISKANLFPKQKRKKTKIEINDERMYTTMRSTVLHRRKRSFFVYKGPLLVGRVDDGKGFIRLLKFDREEKRKQDGGYYNTQVTSLRSTLIDSMKSNSNIYKFVQKMRRRQATEVGLNSVLSPMKTPRYQHTPGNHTIRTLEDEIIDDDELEKIFSSSYYEEFERKRKYYCFEDEETEEKNFVVGPFFKYKDVEHDFLDYTQFDRSSQKLIIEQVAFSESFDDFILRLIRKGFDVNSQNTRRKERRVMGRSWDILLYTTEKKEKVGCIWDYPGAFCTFDFMPLENCNPKSENFSMTVYSKEMEAKLYSCYVRSKNISELRKNITMGDFLYLRTNLYFDIGRKYN